MDVGKSDGGKGKERGGQLRQRPERGKERKNNKRGGGLHTERMRDYNYPTCERIICPHSTGQGTLLLLLLLCCVDNHCTMVRGTQGVFFGGLYWGRDQTQRCSWPRLARSLSFRSPKREIGKGDDPHTYLHSTWYGNSNKRKSFIVCRIIYRIISVLCNPYYQLLIQSRVVILMITINMMMMR